MAQPDPEHPATTPPSMEEVLRGYGPQLKRLSAGYERSPERRRDLVQEILIALHRALPTFQGRSSVRTFVFRVAHNVATTHLLREQRTHGARWVPIEELEACDALSAPDNLEAAAIRKQQLDHLAALVRQLHPTDRQLVLLSFEGLGSTELAEITGLSVTNVTTRLSRVRAALARALGAPNDFPRSSR